MAATVFVSRLRDELAARGVTVAELRRRLEQRGVRVSRGALDRIVSDDPIDAVHLSSLFPILEELDLDFSSAFAQVDAARAREISARRDAIAGLADRIYRDRAGNGTSSVQTREPDAALREQIQHSLAFLKEHEPALYATLVDRRGRLRRKALSRVLRERLGNQGEGTKAEFIALSTTGLLDSHLLKRA
jgi:transcriptional regulator with XRE-family HTH domain